MMFRVDPDAWAAIIAVFVVSISITASITHKLNKKRTGVTFLWFVTEVSTSVLVALLAWEMHPHLKSLLPLWMTQTVFTAVAVHIGSRFIQMISKEVKL